jgi:predicted Zn-dependent protease
MALIAVLVLAWVGVLLRDFKLGYDASVRGFYSPQRTASARSRDLHRLTQARLLDPSSYWQLARASYSLQSGNPRRAATVAEALVRDEPQNPYAWGILRDATRRSDPARSARAAAEIRRLNPLGAR